MVNVALLSFAHSVKNTGFCNNKGKMDLKFSVLFDVNVLQRSSEFGVYCQEPTSQSLMVCEGVS